MILFAIVAVICLIIIAVANVVSMIVRWYYARQIVQARADERAYSRICQEYEWTTRLYTRKGPKVLRGNPASDINHKRGENEKG